MTHHPARAWLFDDLAAALRAAVADGNVSERRDARRPSLALYCYTNRAVYDGAWSPVVEMARGLVLDYDARRVVATPFPKFFNLGERGASLPNEPFEAFDKLDGSLGIIFHDGNGWSVATKGSLTSPQSEWALAWLRAHCRLDALTVGDTYLAEIIYDANRIVVRYPFEGLVLLGAYAADGREYSAAEVHDVADALGTRAVARYAYASVAEMCDAAATFAADREGFVVRFSSGYRVKIKGAEYLRVHRLVSRVTPLAVWEAMAAGDDLDAIRREIPEEFYADFDAIRGALARRFADIVQATEAEHTERRDESDKIVGLALGLIAQPARQFIFARRRYGAAWHTQPKLRVDVCRTFRPTANAIAGYVASAALCRFSEASS